MITVLGIESSCDETAVCILRLGEANHTEILVNLVASQHEVHRPHGGIVPELASRQHIRTLAPMVQAALSQAEMTADQLAGVVVTCRPGLLGSLLVGLSYAKAMAYALGLPFIGVSHLEGHLNAPYLETPDIPHPHLALLVSGGHTALYAVTAFGEQQLVGATRDDAAGEAYDKVAKMLDLGYPGGPIIDRRAQTGNPKAHSFPRGQVKGQPLDFSFSGLKTAVRYHLEAQGGSIPPDNLSESAINDICASFQEAVVDALIQKTIKAAQEYQLNTVLLTGGVACNSRLREKLAATCTEQNIRCVVSSPQYCTDNAAMIAYVGAKRIGRGESSPWDLNAQPTEMMRGPIK